MKTFSIVNLGCKVNRVESDAFSQTLEDLGFHPAEINNADIIVVNTCTVTGEADKKARKAVNHALRENNHGTVYVTGCAAAINPEYFEALDDRIHVVAKAGMLEELQNLSTAEDSTDPTNAPQASYPTRVGVKVQDGCNHACTYCIIHVARGAATSRPASEILEECEQLITSGVKEIVLTGINLGSYQDAQRTLPDLLQSLIALAKTHTAPGDTPCRFRISSVEPMDISDDLITLLATSEGQICRHLHLPLQSGSSKVLSEMNRPYSAEAYGALVHRLREAVPEISLSTDIIVGFPGETDEDFEQTLRLAEQCGFSKIHVFPYSMRQGTPAAARTDQIDPQIKRERAAQLRDLSKTLRQKDWQHRLNTTEFAVIEERGIAMTESHFELTAPKGIAVGSLIPIQLTDVALNDSQF